MKIQNRLTPFVVVACFSSSAFAQDRAAHRRDPAAAEVLFEQGRSAVEHDDFRLACAKFAESYGFDPAAGVLMNWATCEEKLGHLASAWQHWREAISILAVNDERTAYARQQASRLETRLPYLSVRLDRGAPAGCQVLRDDVTLNAASLGLEFPVDPGEHRIVVRAPGYEERSIRVVVAERERKSVAVAPGRKRFVANSRAERPDSGGRRTLGWIAGGVGVAGAAGGVISGLAVAREKQTVVGHCTGHACDQAGVDAARRGKTLLVVNAASWATAAAGIGLGTYLLLSAPAAPRREIGLVEDGAGVAVSYVGSF